MTAPSAAVPALNQLYVYVTNGCNCACRHCWIIPAAAGASRRPARFLPLDLFEASIEEAVPLGLTGVKWTGGEPTIHPEFAGLLQIQKKHGLDGALETNGMRVTPELAGRLRESGVTSVSVSLDGATAATHDAIRETAGGFDLTLAGIGNLVGAGYRPEIIMSLMRANVAELEALLGLAVELGAGRIKLNVVQPALRGLELHADAGALSVSELLALDRRLQTELQPACELPVALDLPMAFRPLASLVEGSGLGRCGIKGILGLLADGHYALCGVGEHVPELVFGPAGVGRLPQIWAEHPLLSTLRQGLPADLKGVCGDCLMKQACLGACVAMNYQQGQSLLAPYWFCSQALAEGFFPLSRLRHEKG